MITTYSSMSSFSINQNNSVLKFSGVPDFIKNQAKGNVSDKATWEHHCQVGIDAANNSLNNLRSHMTDDQIKAAEERRTLFKAWKGKYDEVKKHG